MKAMKTLLRDFDLRRLEGEEVAGEAEAVADVGEEAVAAVEEEEAAELVVVVAVEGAVVEEGVLHLL